MRTSPIHYIAPSSISIIPNANGSANDLAVYVSRDTKIKIFAPGVERLGINPNTNSFREWTLTGRNRRLNGGNGPYTIYARLQKSDAYVTDGSAYLVFAAQSQYGPDNPYGLAGQWFDKYSYVMQDGLAGQYDERGFPKIVDHPDYWWVKLGTVSELNESSQRTVELDTGILGTEQWNTEWTLNPDDLPLRIELECSIGGNAVGMAPYVLWGQQLDIKASLVEGWEKDASGRVLKWTITRNSGNAQADEAWNHPVADTGEETTEESEEETTPTERIMTDGQITLAHTLGDSDDFAAAVAATFTITAWGEKEEEEAEGTEDGESADGETDNTQDQDGSQEQDTQDGEEEQEETEEPELVPLTTAVITVYAETVATYELELSAGAVTYNPVTQAYSPANGVSVRIRAKAQDGSLSYPDNAYITTAQLRVLYWPVDEQQDEESQIPELTLTDGRGLLPVTAFADGKSINLWLENGAQVVLARTTVAYIRYGEKGDTPVSIYRWYKAGLTPVKPTAENSEEPAPADADATGETNVYPTDKWSKTMPDRPDTGEWNLWQCNSIKHGDGTIDAWQGPVRVSGEKGEAGIDASDREYIYKRMDVYPFSGTLPANITTPDASSTGQTVADDDFVPSGWSDTALPAAADEKYVYISIREKPAGKNQTWGPFSNPQLWSNWGVMGSDGDGVQYAYKLFDHELTSAERTSNIPTKPSEPNANGEWIPEGWSDDPLVPTHELPYCYCSVIKQIDGTWGQFGALGLWSRWSKDGGTPVSRYQWGTSPTVCPSYSANAQNPGSGWKEYAPDRPTTDGDHYLWMISAIRKADGTYGPWGNPVRLTGDKGSPGADGADREWIYISTQTYSSPYSGTLPKDITRGRVNGQGDWIAKADQYATDDYVPEGWSDRAIAVDSSDNRYVYASWRDKAVGGNTWGDFSTPILWSNWGEKGEDGDGVQYIYKLFNHELTSSERTDNIPDRPSAPNASGEWIPSSSDTTNKNYGWSDNPQAPTINNPYCYCSVIKEIDGVWGLFGALGLWSRWAEDGGTPESRYKWGDSVTTSPEYSAMEQNPGSGWQSTVPDRPGNGYYLWMISAIRKADGTYGMWGNPVRLSGDKGEPGEDSKEREWIYRKNNTEGYQSTSGMANGTTVSGTTTVGDVSVYKCFVTDDFVPTDWSDSPQGVTASGDTEYASWRDYDKVAKRWGAFHQPIIWSHHGERGMDGDGLQYIYKLFDHELDSDEQDNLKPTNATQNAVGEWLPSSSDENNVNYGWSDDPQSPTASQPYCYCSIIKKTNNVWGTFGTLGLWAVYSESGLIADIDNEMDAFGTDIDGKVLILQKPTAHISMFYGMRRQTITRLTATVKRADTADIISNEEVVEVTISGVNSDSVTVEVAIKAQSTTLLTYDLYVDIEAECGLGTRTARFTLKHVSSGAPGISPTIYQLLPSESSLTFSKNTDGNGYTPPSRTLTCGYTATTGTSVTSQPNSQSVGSYRIYYRTAASSSYTKLTSAGVDVTSANTFVELVMCTNTADTVAAANVTGLIDRETVPVVKDGLDGSNGDIPLNAYRWYKEGLTPLKPTSTSSDEPARASGDYGGSGDADKVYPTDKWSKTAHNRPAEGWRLWMTQSVKHIANNGTVTRDAWSTPVCISGSDGTPGEDAKEREWIYRRNSNAGYNSTTGTAKGVSVSGKENDIYKCYLTDDFVPTNWNDNPQGVDKDNTIEYASWRDYDHTAQQWGDFQAPIIWSHYGRNGMDGDGVEYVFARTTSETAPKIANNNSYTSDGKTITVADDEFLPAVSGANTMSGTSVISQSRATDDPQGVTMKLPYEWVAKRTKGAANAETGLRSWEGYTVGDMQLWAKWGKDGETAWLADLDNEMDSVSCDDTGHPVYASGDYVNVATTLALYYGSTPKTFGTPSVKRNGSAVTVRTTYSSSGFASGVQVVYNSSAKTLTVYYNTAATISGKDIFTITLTATDDSTVTRTLTFTVNGIIGDVYNLSPNISQIKIEGTETSYSGLTCGYTKNVNGAITEYSAPEATTTYSTLRIDGKYNIYFRRRTKSSGEWEASYYLYTYSTYNSYVSALGVNTYDAVEFVLCTSTGRTASALSNIIDRETIYVITDGTTYRSVDAYKRSTTALTSTDKPTITTITDTTTDAGNGWSLVQPSGTGDIYISHATFKNGSKISGWSAPVKFSGEGKEGTSPWVADLDNEMDSIACDSNGKPTSAQSVQTTVALYYGSTTKGFSITSVKRSYGSNSSYTYSSSGTANGGVTVTWNNSTGVITVSYATSATVTGRDIFTITMLSADNDTQTGAKVTRTLTLTVNGVMPGKQGDAAVIYKLVPSVSSIVKRKDGSYVPSTNITCAVMKISGNSTPQAAPSSDYTLKKILNGGSEQSYSETSPSAVTSNLTFVLYVDGTMVDKESVPLVIDGNDGVSPEAPPVTWVATAYKRFTSAPSNDKPTDTTNIYPSTLSYGNNWSKNPPAKTGGSSYTAYSGIENITQSGNFGAAFDASHYGWRKAIGYTETGGTSTTKGFETITIEHKKSDANIGSWYNAEQGWKRVNGYKTTSSSGTEKGITAISSPMALSAGWAASDRSGFPSSEGWRIAKGYTVSSGGGGTGGIRTIGSEESESDRLPFYNMYNHSLSQQIYTPAEIGGAGTITSIAFYNTGSQLPSANIRTIDIYLVHSDKSAFSSKSDWITVSDNDLVYSGSSLFPVGWNTFELNKSFVYNGTSNLVVIVKTTGQYKSGPKFKAYTSTDGCSILYYNDNVTPDPEAPSVTANYLYGLKNIIQLGFAASGSGSTTVHNDGVYMADRIDFTTVGSDNTFSLMIAASAEDADGVYVLLDSTPNSATEIANISESSTVKKVSGTESETVNFNVATAGSHFVCIVFKKDSGGDYGNNDEGYYRIISTVGTSGGGSDSTTTHYNNVCIVDRINFTTRGENNELKLYISSSTEATYDGVYVSEVKSQTAAATTTAISSIGDDFKATGVVSNKLVTINVPNEGSYCVDVVFYKDGSNDANEDYAMYRLDTQEGTETISTDSTRTHLTNITLYDTITFKAYGAQTFQIELAASCGTSDYIYVARTSSASPTSSYVVGQKQSGTGTGIVDIPVQGNEESGTVYTYYVIYKTASTGSGANDDTVWYRIVSTEGISGGTVTPTSGLLWKSVATIVGTSVSGSWSDPVQDEGDEGPASTTPGPAGYTVIATPANLIINETSTGQYDVTSSNPAFFDFMVTKGTSTQNLVTNVAVAGNYCIKNTNEQIVTASKVSNGNRIQVTDVSSAAKSNKYTTGHLVITITADGRTFSMTIPIAVNFAATMFHGIVDAQLVTIAEDVKTSIENDGTFVVNDNNYQSYVDAVSGLQTWKQQKERIYDDAVDSITNINTRLSSAEGNISTVSTTANNAASDAAEAKSSVTTVVQTANRISSQIDSGTNLLANSFFELNSSNWADDWNRSGTSVYMIDNPLVAGGAQCYIPYQSTQQYLRQQVWGSSSYRKLADYSWFTLTFYAKCSGNFRVMLRGSYTSRYETAIVVNGKETQFSGTSNLYVDIATLGSGSFAFYSLQFKTKTVTANSTTVYIEFAAPAYDLYIAVPRLYKGLSTGINIQQNIIDVTANNFTIRNNDGNVSLGVDAFGNLRISGAMMSNRLARVTPTYNTSNYSVTPYYVNAEKEQVAMNGNYIVVEGLELVSGKACYIGLPSAMLLDGMELTILLNCFNGTKSRIPFNLVIDRNLVDTVDGTTSFRPDDAIEVNYTDNLTLNGFWSICYSAGDIDVMGSWKGEYLAVSSGVTMLKFVAAPHPFALAGGSNRADKCICWTLVDYKIE